MIKKSPISPKLLSNQHTTHHKEAFEGSIERIHGTATTQSGKTSQPNDPARAACHLTRCLRSDITSGAGISGQPCGISLGGVDLCRPKRSTHRDDNQGTPFLESELLRSRGRPIYRMTGARNRCDMECDDWCLLGARLINSKSFKVLLTDTVRPRYKRQLIQLSMNKSGLHALEWKTRDPYSLVDDSLVLLIPQFCPHRPGTVVEQQGMETCDWSIRRTAARTGPDARTAPDRTFDAIVFLHFSAYLPENLDIATIAGPLPI